MLHFMYLMKCFICLFVFIHTAHSCCCVGAWLAKQAISSSIGNDDGPDFVERIITRNMEDNRFGCRENEIEAATFAFPVITAKGLKKHPTLVPKKSEGQVVQSDSLVSSFLDQLHTNSQKISHTKFTAQVGSEFKFPSSQDTELVCKLVSFELYFREISLVHEHAQTLAAKYNKSVKEIDFAILLARHAWTKLQLDVENSTARHFVFTNKGREETAEGYHIVFAWVREEVPLLTKLKRRIRDRLPI